MPTLLKRLLYGLLTLLIIAYLTLFGLSMAERGREGRPAEPLSVAGEALIRTGEYIFDHPTTYHWHRYVFPAFELVATTFRHSAGLLLVALTGAALLGILLGTVLALTKHKVGATLMLFFSILGVSTPSFLLAMLLWVINIQMHRRLDVTALPSAGFGWDAHLIMPALVLAARPLAQITQVTYVTLSEVLEKDYIRTARAKGLKEHLVYLRHAMRNALIPILTTMGASLRFSLASLPVVELFFDWPGVGLMLLEAIELGKVPLVTDLTVSLGLFFLLINSGLAFLYPLIDPQLRNGATSSQRREEMSLGTVIARMRSTVASIWEDLRHKLPGQRESESKLRPLPSPKEVGNHAAYDEADRPSQARWLLGSILRNPALIVGTLLILGLVVIAIGGERMTSANPYEIHGVMMVEGEIGAPPYPPSATFPWGTDYIGRDMRALVLAGARQTLSLAFFGMVARVILGTLLGMIAGWWHDSRVDQVIGGAIDVWAAFPVTIFAMLLIQALGIQQGMWVFVVALCIVGWGEVAQFVRGQVIAIKPQLYIEAARATGAHAYQMLMRHIIPNLLPSLLVLSAMEMGGVLMLLAELGYLNVFLGGGFKVEMIGEVIEHFSDVPEWGALLASIRQWWRSYPWMALYPGGAFFISIVACNLWAEGLRHLLMKSRINLTRFFNRYLLVALAGVAVGLFLMLRSTAPLGVYRSQARQFDAERAMADIEALTAPAFEGRETGTEGAAEAARYIADEMEAIGLFPAGESGAYLKTNFMPRYHLTGTPTMAIVDEAGQVTKSFPYREAFVERGGVLALHGEFEGPIVGLATGPVPDAEAEIMVNAYSYISYKSDDVYGLLGTDLREHVIIIREEEFWRVNLQAAGGVLVVSEDPHALDKRYLFGNTYRGPDCPTMVIPPEVADDLLATTNVSLAQLDAQRETLGVGEYIRTGPGARLHLNIPVAERLDDEEHYVIGFIPGAGAAMGDLGQALDNQVILIGAYYDGLGVDPTGTLYPGANDNASGVATMLEIARVLQSGQYTPKKTVVFVAWAGGERYDSLSVTQAMSAKLGFSSLTVEAVIELSGVGAGAGESIALGQGSSYRLLQLFQDAAGRMGATTTTRGRGPHHGMFSRASYGGRSELAIYLSRDGTDHLVHTPMDNLNLIDPASLQEIGETSTLAITVLSRETEY